MPLPGYLSIQLLQFFYEKKNHPAVLWYSSPTFIIKKKKPNVLEVPLCVIYVVCVSSLQAHAECEYVHVGVFFNGSTELFILSQQLRSIGPRYHGNRSAASTSQRASVFVSQGLK